MTNPGPSFVFTSGVPRGPRPRAAFPEAPAPKRWDLVERLAQKFTSGDDGFVTVGDEFISELSTTALAVALRRYKLDHGEYPVDLSALVPAYLAEVPLDPYTGKSAAYSRQGAGFTLLAHPNLKVWQPALTWNVVK